MFREVHSDRGQCLFFFVLLLITMASCTKRKVDFECRAFNKQWTHDYFMIDNNNKALCLICNETVAVLKEFNVRRHYETKHKSKYSNLTGKLREDKIASLKNSLSIQRQIFTNQSQQNEAAVKASFKVSHILAKAGKPFTDGQLVKDCILVSVEEICPDKRSLFNAISLSANTVARRTEDLGNNVVYQLKDACKDFEWFSIALDESTDVTDSAQVLLFVRGVNSDFKITEELADVHSMESSVTGDKIFAKISETISNLGLDFKRMRGVTTDGGKNMSGTKTGVVGNICNSVKTAGGVQPVIYHCIIHQQALCGKHIDVAEVMNVVVKTVNFIRSSSLKHRQFKNFLAEIDSAYPDVPYHCEVRWLSRGKVFQRFFELREVIGIFMTEQRRPVPELSDSVFVWKLAFLVDLTAHINFLNLKLQGENSSVCDLYWHVKAFRKKLILFEKHLGSMNFDHFESCQNLSALSTATFPKDYVLGIMSKLRQEFENRFEDFDRAAEDIQMFQNPFKCDIDKVPAEMQLEVIELTTNDSLKTDFQECYKEGNLLTFYSSLPEKDFKNIKNHARAMFSLFGSTYKCEQTFSKMKFVKSKYRSSLSDEHLKSILMIGTTKFDPKWAEILSGKQMQSSH